MPTAGLAMLAAQQINQGGKRQARVIDGYGRLPIQDRSVNEFLENWMAPVRRWYNADVSTVEYSELDAARADAVLEIGILNHGYVSDQ